MKINFEKRLDLYDLEFNLEEIQAMEIKILQENQIVPSLFFVGVYLMLSSLWLRTAANRTLVCNRVSSSLKVWYSEMA